jgi:hypothetical protein
MISMNNIGKFAYSFDRESFRGNFNTRQQAIDAGLTAAQDLGNPPEAIYVGARQAIDPGSSDHAETIIEKMRRRTFERYGDKSADFLAHVNEQQLADLDHSVQQTIATWLVQQNLTPAFERIGSVTEHPVTIVSAAL